MVNPVAADGHSSNEVPLVGGMFFKKADEPLVADLDARGLLFRHAPVRARLPALLAVPHAADLLRPALVVHPHDRAQGRPAGAERADELVPADHPVGPVRGLAAQQHRLGAEPGPLLGHTPAHLALPAGPPDGDRLAGANCRPCRARTSMRLDPAPTVRRRRDAARAPSATRPCRRVPEVIDCWYDSGAMPFAQFGYPHRGIAELRGQLPGRLHLRSHRPDPRLVLHAHGGRDAGVRRVAATATCCAWATSSTRRAAR